MQDRAASFLEELSNHSLWKVLQERHVPLHLIAPMLLLNVALHLHGVAVRDTVDRTVLPDRLNHLGCACPGRGMYLVQGLHRAVEDLRVKNSNSFCWT